MRWGGNCGARSRNLTTSGTNFPPALATGGGREQGVEVVKSEEGTYGRKGEGKMGVGWPRLRFREDGMYERETKTNI